MDTQSQGLPMQVSEAIQIAAKIMGDVFTEGELHIIQNALHLKAKPVHTPIQPSGQTSTIWDFKVGDRVRFTRRANPKYLIGTYCTVTGHKRTNITVKLDAANGRFSGGNITCPLSIIEKV